MISLSLKSTKQPTMELSIAMLKRQIAQEFYRHREIEIKIEAYRQRFLRIMQEEDLADHLNQMEQKCDEALKQIRDKGYQEELRLEGFKNIWSYGVCFWKKEACVRIGEKEIKSRSTLSEIT